MITNRPAIWAAIYFAGQLLMSCSGAQNSISRGQAEIEAGYESSSPNVISETIDGSGLFIKHQVIPDPLRPQYEKGVWTASNSSHVESLNQPTNPDNRIHVVFVGDGYTQVELPTYRSDVSRILAALKKETPFLNYWNYFAFTRVDVVSMESGVDQDPKGVSRDTALGMAFHCSGIDRLLCANLNQVSSEAKNAGPVDFTFAMANSSTYGGAGYLSPAISTFAARNAASLDLALHEFGHSFGKLTDEYDTAGVATDCGTFPNSSAQDQDRMLNNHSKWYRWLNVAHIGAFQGSCYSKAQFRPTDHSKMRALGNPFEEVNTEQLILQIYSKVTPIDSVSITGTGKAQVFHVTPMRPGDHELQVRWSVDGVEEKSLRQAKKSSWSQLKLKPGTHHLVVTVTDTTSLVRDEQARAHFMTQTQDWTLSVPE